MPATNLAVAVVIVVISLVAVEGAIGGSDIDYK